MNENESLTGLEIAVVGMAARFPGAKNIHQFWENIKNGVESFQFYSEEYLEKCGVTGDTYNQPNFVKSNGGILEGMEYFDADFFNYTPIEAKILDPQIRLFHECTWEALEDAGYDPTSYEGLIGLFGGAEDNTDWREKVFLSLAEGGTRYTHMLLSCKDFISSRIAYKFNLKGPVYAIVTGCSTALSAIHLACRSLLGGECDMALAGCAYVSIPDIPGRLYREGLLQSEDGHLRAFDSRASGTVFSSGVGAVVLKPYEDALEDNDHIYALVKGSAVNSDGNRKVNFTAPSVEGQTNVLKAAYQAAEIEPETVSYIETHGTGTPLGDPIEINALKQVFKNTPGWKCPIGSVKTNIGHLDVASGAASFIKSALILKYRLIPPSLNFETSNPQLELESSPFYVNTQLQEISANGVPLRVGVSSFGFGGTNAHAILEEVPKVEGTIPSKKMSLFLFSAKTQDALASLTQRFQEFFQLNPTISLADVAYTLQVGRQPFQYRTVCTGSSRDEVISSLDTTYGITSYDDPALVFMFSGQGSQYINMGVEIYREEPQFREEMDHCFDILNSLTHKNFKEMIYPSPGKDLKQAQSLMNDVLNSGPIKFIFEYSLGKLLIKWGIRPSALMGHSFGEYAAACLAGVFSLEDALKIARLRGELIMNTPPGGMMSIAIPGNQLEQYLVRHPNVSLAAENSSSHCYVSGLKEELENLETELQGDEIECMHLNFPRAAHSSIMKSISSEFSRELKEIQLNEAKIPMISGLTGNLLASGQINSAEYWSQHLVETVRFSQGLQIPLKESNAIFLQVGSDKGLPLFVKQHHQFKQGTPVLNLVKHKKDKIPDMKYLFEQIGTLWQHGVKINWQAIQMNGKRQRISLPTYPFESKRYWIDLNPKIIWSRLSEKQLLKKRENISDWLYTSSWKRCPLNQTRMENSNPKITPIVFSDGIGLGELLKKKFEENNHEVILIKPGTNFEQETSHNYRLNPSSGDNYDKLFQDLKNKKIKPGYIIHLWNIDHEINRDFTFALVQKTMELGFYSLVHMVQSMGRLSIYEDIHLDVITNNMQQVMGEEFLCPEKSPILGAIGVIPKEYPNISCRSLDVLLPESNSLQEKNLVNQLYERIVHPLDNHQFPIMSLRGNHFWRQVYEATPNTKQKTVPSLLKKSGVYLITGGLGGIGYELANYLAKTVTARLILTGRSSLPQKTEWRQWLDTHPKENSISQKILKIRELEKKGSEVLVLQADSSQKEQMQKVITQIMTSYKELNGIIHAAGLIDQHGIIQQRTREMTENILAPKIKGTIILDQLTKEIPMDFFIVCSSLASLFPGFGEVGYAAANIFIDAFAHYRSFNSGKITIAINWDTWKEVGAAVNISKRKQAEGKKSVINLMDGICTSEGIKAFTQILENPNPQMVVSTRDLNRLLENTYRKKIEDNSKNGQNERVPTKQSQVNYRPRPKLSLAYSPPGNSVQRDLAKVWQDYFGIAEIGINDDFFELGGDSLMGTVMIAKIHKKMNVRIPLVQLFQNPTIKLLDQFLKSLEKDECIPITAVEKKEYYPLSPPQKRLFILHQMDRQNVSYNSPFFLTLKGNLDKKRLSEMLNKMIGRHESLRTSFELLNGKPVQRISNFIESDLEYFSSNPIKAKSIVADFIRSFNLELAPLLRLGLIKTDENIYIYMFDMHHIITDGTSLEIFARELLVLYEGLDLQPLKLQYKDFSQWQNQVLNSENGNRQEKYWLKEFAGEIPRLELPTDFTRPRIQSFEGKKYPFKIDTKNFEKMSQLAQKQNVTLNMITLAIFGVLINRFSVQETIIIGTSSAGRQHDDLQNIIGMFVNTLPIKIHVPGQLTFCQYLQAVKEKSLAAIENQDYPFEDLVEKLDLNRDMGRNPLFDISFSYQNFEAPPVNTNTNANISAEKTTQKLRREGYQFNDLSSRFDLTLFARETANTLLLIFEYCTKLFRVETIERLAIYFNITLSTLLDNPDSQLGNIEILASEDKQRLLFDWNDTGLKYPDQKTINQLFKEQVNLSKHHLVVIDEKIGAITYQYLDEMSTLVAQQLIQNGFQEENIAAVLMNPSIDIVIMMLGILRAGGTYLPLDPQSPGKRLHYMLKDSNAIVLLYERPFLDHIDFDGDENLPIAMDVHSISSTTFAPGKLPPVHSTNLAYIIYTSGTTGKPKGVMINHSSLVNLCYWHNMYFKVTVRDRASQYASIGFDASIWEIFPYLIKGASIYFIPNTIKLDIQKLNLFFNTYRITIGFLPTQFCEQFMTISGENPSLRLLLTGGDKLQTHTKTNYPLYNNYGPTENTVVSTSLMVNNDCIEIPIGKPIANTQVYIYHPGHLILQPPGIVGELFIAGKGIARGYLNNPQLTGEKFVRIELMENSTGQKNKISQKLYRSGDLGKWLPGGDIQFMGRIDTQIKIRGFRIEKDEIEHTLQSHPKIERAIVHIIEKNQNKSLCAYYKSNKTNEETINTKQLKEHLLRFLPEYMIPVYFVPITKIPISANGKIDYKSLPDPIIEENSDYIMPNSQSEKMIADIWKDILGIEKIGIHTPFFDIGGNSTNILQVHNRLKKLTNMDIPIMSLFLYPTIFSLGNYFKNHSAAENEDKSRDNLQVIEDQSLMKQSLQKLKTLQ